MTETTKIAIFYGHVASNIGDLAINRGQIELLAQAFPGASVKVCMMNADRSEYLDAARASFGETGVAFAFVRPNSGKAPSYVADPGSFLDDCGVGDADLVVLSAGEHLFYYADGANIGSFFWRTLPALAAKARGKRCVIMPSTLGPFEDPQAASLAKQLLRLVDGYAVRDTVSALHLQAGGFATLPPERLPDPAFFLPPPAAVAAVAGRTIGFVMRAEDRGIRLARAGGSIKEAAPENTVAFTYASRFVQEVLTDPSASIVVFVQTQADQALATALASKFASFGQRIRLASPVSVDDYVAQLAAVDVIVASRFHAVIMGAVAGTPGIGLYFDQHGHKMPGLFGLLGIEDRCFDLSSIDAAHAAAESARMALDLIGKADPTGPKLQALRAATVDWLRGIVNRNIGPEALLDASRAYGTIAARLMAEGVRIDGVAKLKQAATAKASLQEQLGEAKRMADAALVECRGYKSQAANLEAGRVRLERERDAAIAARAETASRLEGLERKLLHADGERVQQARRHAAEMKGLRKQAERDVWNERDRWTSLLAYRAGDVLVANIGSPLRWPLLPFKLFREWRAYRKDHASRLVASPPGFAAAETATVPALAAHAVAPAASRNDEDHLAYLRERGAEGLVARIVEERGLGGKPLAMELLRIGKASSERGDLSGEFSLAEAALRLDESPAVLKGVFWASQRAGQYAMACEAAMKLDRALAGSDNPVDLKALAQMKSAPAYQLSSLSLLEAPGPYRIQPVPRRICYVLHNSLPYSSGGYATRAHGIASGLSSHGYEVLSITRPGFPFDIKPDLDAEAARGDVIDGIRYTRIERPYSKGISVPNYVAQSADELTRVFRENRPEIVVAASNYRIGLMAMIAARRLGIPFIYEVRGWWELTRMSRDTAFVETPSYAVQAQLEQAVADRSDHVFTLTEPMREALIERGTPAAKVTLLPNSCDIERFEPAPRDRALAADLAIPHGVPVIGYVGTFVDYEGLEDLAHACGLLAGRGLDFRLMLVGNENTSGQERGPISAQIVEIAANLEFSERLIMPGRVPHEEVERYYSLVDIACFPRKPWPVCEMVSPMKPLEALAMEKAVVASDVRALAEMLRDGETGLLFRKGDVVSLADTLERLIRDEGMRRQLGARGREWVRSERTWNKTAGAAHEILSGIVSHARG